MEKLRYDDDSPEELELAKKLRVVEDKNGNIKLQMPKHWFDDETLSDEEQDLKIKQSLHRGEAC